MTLDKDGNNIEKSIDDTAGLTGRMFYSPPVAVSMSSILLFTFLTGGIISLSPYGLMVSTLAFLLPGLLFALLSNVLLKGLKRSFHLKRAFMLTASISGLILPIMLIGKAVSMVFSVDIIYVIITSICITIIVSHMSFMAVAGATNAEAFAISYIYPVTGVLLLSPLGLTAREYEYFAVLMFFLTLSELIFITIVNSVFRKTYGTSATQLCSNAISHFADGSKKEEIEHFFSLFSSEQEVETGIYRFVRKDGNDEIATVIVPGVHPGPFGKLGGSDLPEKMNAHLSDSNVMYLHSASTHDENPIDDDEVAKVAVGCRNAIEVMNYSDTVSGYEKLSEDGINIHTRRFGDTSLLVYTPSPQPGDDVDAATGKLCEAKAGRSVFVDAHNCIVKGKGSVFFNTEKSGKMIDLCERAVIPESNRKFSAGYARTVGFDISHGIGPAGIQCLTIREKKTFSYILIDGNNMVPGLRDEIIKSLKSIVDDAEVMTSDNHIVNWSIDSYIPVGKKISPDTLIEEVKKTVEMSLSNLHEAKVGTAKIKTHLKVFGKNSTSILTNAINTSIYVLKYAFVGLVFSGILSIIATWFITI